MTHIPSLNFDLGEDIDLLRDAVYDFAQADVEFTGLEAEARVELIDSDDKHMHVRLS